MLVAVVTPVAGITLSPATTPVAAVGDDNHGHALIISATRAYLVRYDTGGAVTEQVDSVNLGVTLAVDVMADTTTSTTLTYFYVLTSASPCQVVLVTADYTGATPSLTAATPTSVPNTDGCGSIAGMPYSDDGYVAITNLVSSPPRERITPVKTTPVGTLTPGTGDTTNNGDRPIGCGVGYVTNQYWGLNTSPGLIVESTYDPNDNEITVSGNTLELDYPNVVACTIDNDQAYFAATGAVIRVDLGAFTVQTTFVPPAGTNDFAFVEYNPAYNDVAVVTSGAPAAMARLARNTLTVISGVTDFSTGAVSTFAVGNTHYFVSAGTTVEAALLPAPPPPPPPAPLNCGQHSDCPSCTATACQWCTSSRTCEDASVSTCSSLISTCPSPVAASPKSGGSNAGLAVGLTFMFLVLIGGAAAAGFLYWKRQQNSYTSTASLSKYDSTTFHDTPMSASEPVAYSRDTATRSLPRNQPSPTKPAAPWGPNAAAAKPEPEPTTTFYRDPERAAARAQAEQYYAEPEPEYLDDYAAPAAAGAAVAAASTDAIGYDNAFFAVDDLQMSEDGFAAPAVVTECIAWLHDRGLNEEGLFRIPGNQTIMKSLLARYNAGETGLVAELRDEHDVAGLLKLYFREQSSPVTFPRSFYPRLADAQNISDRLTRIAAMRSLLTCLTPGRFALLGELVGLFVAVSNNYKVNKMKPKNMALVFAPTLMKGMAVGTATSILTTWIKDFYDIFQAEDYPQFD